MGPGRVHDLILLGGHGWCGLVFQFFVGRPRPQELKGVSHILGGPLWGARGGGVWFSNSGSVAPGPGFLMAILIFWETPFGEPGVVGFGFPILGASPPAPGF